MLSTIRALLLAAVCTSGLGCSRSPDSTLAGEWTQRRLDAVDHVTVLTDHITYRADHTFVRVFEDPRRGVTNQSGTWRIEGQRIIWQSREYGESRAEILRLTRDDFQVTAPGGVVGEYKR